MHKSLASLAISGAILIAIASSGSQPATAGPSAFDAAVDCIGSYSQDGRCDWNHWSEMYQRCGLGNFPALSSREVITKVQNGECAWHNFPNFAASLLKYRPNEPQQQFQQPASVGGFDIAVSIVGFSGGTVYIDVVNNGPQQSRPGYIWVSGSDADKVRTPGQFRRQVSIPGLNARGRTRVTTDATALEQANPGATLKFTAQIDPGYDTNASNNFHEQFFRY
ncbi:MAG: hypothetical protein GC150_17020 [Rhizobiales bacterium]|nr:hypothetical protein [Hyphomicrobiales bacterium]